MKKLLFLLFPLFAQAQVEQVISVPVDASASFTDQALLSLPADYSTSSKKYPLLVFLPGVGESSSPLSSMYNSSTAGGPSYFIEHGAWPATFTNPITGTQEQFIVVSPQSNNQWSVFGGQLQWIINYMALHYRVDPARINLTGLSAGGAGNISFCSHLDNNDNSLGHFNPTYKIAAFVPMSEANGAPSKAVTDTITALGTQCWGFGDPNGDPHGYNTLLLTQGIKGSRFTSYSGGHCCWNTFYNPSYTEVINGKAMNIYSWMLGFTSAGTLPVPPVVIPPVVIPPVVQPTKPKVNNCPSNVRYYLAQGYGNGVVIADPSSDYGAGDYNPHQYLAGDTLVLKGTYGDLAFDGLHGNATGCPITIINEGLAMATSLHITNSTDYVVTGTGLPGVFYGITVQGDPLCNNNTNSVGMSFEGRSKAATYDHIFVHNVQQGMFGHTSTACADSLLFPNWVMDSLNIHDCKIVGTAHEGMYIGSTSPDNGPASYDPQPSNCNGVVSYPRPMFTGYVHVYNNIVDSTGRGGIQLVSEIGNSEINNNNIRHAGMSGITNQGTGISIGEYTHSYIHDNTVINTLTWGIASLGGSGTNLLIRIENNTIDSSGYLTTYNNIADTAKDCPGGPFYAAGKIPGNVDNLSWVSSIFLKTVATQNTDSTRWSVTGNKIGKHISQYPIDVQDGYGTAQKNGSIICPNYMLDGTTANNTFFNELSVSVNINTCSAPIILPPVNQPRAQAGADQTITLPVNTATLDATNSSYVTISIWRQLSGPGVAVIGNPGQQKTIVAGLIAGVYQFQLNINNGISLDTMQVTVLPSPIKAPTVTASLISASLFGLAVPSTGLTITSYLWTQASGPTKATIISPSEAQTIVNGLSTGVYVFKLMAIDSKGLSGTNTVTLTVK